MIRQHEELKAVPKILVPKKYYDKLHLLKSTLGKPMSEIQREGLLMVLEKYSKNPE